MVKKQAVKGGKSIGLEPYPREPLDLGIAAEAARRNVDLVVWYKRLIDSTLGLLAASIIFAAITIIFAWLQPLPKLYGSALDGGLRPIDYVRSSQDPRLTQMRQQLLAEEASRSRLADQQQGVSGSKAKLSIKPASAPPAPAKAVVPPAR